MRDIKSIDLKTQSTFTNVVRQYFKEKNFFECFLYSCIPYKISNTDYFNINENTYLRYNCEPEIYKYFESYSKFFWIGSIFRAEKRISKLHRCEFTLLDFYKKNSSLDECVSIFFNLMKYIEKTLSLKHLSRERLIYVNYEEFRKDAFLKQNNRWYIVLDYPKNESFYDSLKNGLKTSKSELFFCKDKEVIEIASCGEIGINQNEQMIINDSLISFNRNIYKEHAWGLGLGIERLIMTYLD